MLGIVDADGILYRACWNVEDLNEAKEKYLDILKGYLTESWCDESISFVGGNGNWRYRVFKDYKGNRKPDPNRTKEMEIIRELKEWLGKERLAIRSHGLEADDLVRRKANKCLQREQSYVIISADKDLDCIVGKHVRPNQRGDIKEYTVSEDDAEYNYYIQVLIGDMTDNIKSPKRLGVKTAEKLLKGSGRTEWKRVIEREYKERCGDEWFHALMFTGSLIHIQRYQDDYFVWDKDKGNFWECGFEGPPKCYEYKEKDDEQV